jgi:hypothetical protein
MTLIATINWEAMGAVAELLAVILTIASVYFAWQTIKEASDDAKISRDQQSVQFQGTVMSACMQEYFAIRNETAKDWRAPAAGHDKKQEIQDLYSERMYGLHFEQYHLFRQRAIPRHIYAIWLKSLKDEIKTTKEYYPQLKIGKYIDEDPKEDFNIFISQILRTNISDKEIEDLVSKESNLPSYQ